MGTLLDTSVLIWAERAGRELPLAAKEEVAIATSTASELLHGVHRADPRHRAQRAAFVEHVLRVFPLNPSISPLPGFMPGYGLISRRRGSASVPTT